MAILPLPADVASLYCWQQGDRDGLIAAERDLVMPMIDAYIPERALESVAEERLLKELTDILLGHEGFDPSNQRAQNVSIVFLHRPAAIYVAGTRAIAPRYRITPTVPEGQYTDAARRSLVKDVTEAIVRAEGGTFEDVAPRVWVFPSEITDGHWGSRGVIRRLPEIQAFIAGEQERRLGEERLARSRRAKALSLFEAALDAVRRGSVAD